MSVLGRQGIELTPVIFIKGILNDYSELKRKKMAVSQRRQLPSLETEEWVGKARMKGLRLMERKPHSAESSHHRHEACE